MVDIDPLETGRGNRFIWQVKIPTYASNCPDGRNAHENQMIDGPGTRQSPANPISAPARLARPATAAKVRLDVGLAAAKTAFPSGCMDRGSDAVKSILIFLTERSGLRTRN